MKFILSFILLLIKLSIFGQNLLVDTTSRQIDVLLNKAADKSISDQERKELKELTYTIQNKGLSIEERLHDYKKSLAETDKALAIWIVTADTINEANNRKFRGYLLGHLNRFAEAKREIAVAIYLFKLKNKDYGVAVSEFDLSKVYAMEGRLDSAILFANSSLKFWSGQNDTFRIITINNQLINVLCKSKKYVEAKAIQERVSLMITDELNWHPLTDFYFLSAQLYDKLNEKKPEMKYDSLYREELDALKKGGTIIKSEYDL